MVINGCEYLPNPSIGSKVELETYITKSQGFFQRTKIAGSSGLCAAKHLNVFARCRGRPQSATAALCSLQPDALREDKTVAARYQVHPNQISTWKRQAMDGLGAIFSNG